MPYSWNALTSTFDLVSEPPSGASDVFHTGALTAGKVVIGDGTDFVEVSGIDVDALDNMTGVNTLAVDDIATTQQNLDLEPGVDVQAFSAALADISGLTLAEGDILYVNGTPALANLPAATDGNTLTLVAGVPAWTPEGITWTVVTAATQAISLQNGYIGNRGTAISYSLPATCSVGDSFKITNIGVGLPIITQGAGQSINFTASSTTVGPTGSLTGVSQFASIEIICVVEDLTFNVINSESSWTVA